MAIGLRKPALLSYSDYIGECSQLLGTAGDAESDHLLPYFIRLQHFAEDVHRAYEYDSIFHFHQKLDSLRVDILAKHFQQQLSDMAMTFPPNIWDNGKNDFFLCGRQATDVNSSHVKSLLLFAQSLPE